MLRKWVSISFVVLSIASPSFAGGSHSNLIVFGDSLSDAASFDARLNDSASRANNTWVKVGGGGEGAPITSVNQKTGKRFMWPNYFLRKGYIYPSSQAREYHISPIDHNVNYAWASAETGSNYVNDAGWIGKAGYPPYNNLSCSQFGPGKINDKSSCVPGLLLQVEHYLNDVNHQPNPNSLIIIWAGGNDLFNNIAKIVEKNKGDNPVLLLLKMMNAAFPVFNVGAKPLSNPVKNIKLAVSRLIDEGIPAHNIYVVGLPNIAKTPAVIKKFGDNQEVLLTLTTISTLYNTALKLELTWDLFDPTNNLPKGNIISVYALLEKIFDNPLMYGFSHTGISCTQEHKQPDCEGFLFFNLKHPASETHEKLAKTLRQVISS